MNKIFLAIFIAIFGSMAISQAVLSPEQTKVTIRNTSSKAMKQVRMRVRFMTKKEAEKGKNATGQEGNVRIKGMQPNTQVTVDVRSALEGTPLNGIAMSEIASVVILKLNGTYAQGDAFKFQHAKGDEFTTDADNFEIVEVLETMAKFPFAIVAVPSTSVPVQQEITKLSIGSVSTPEAEVSRKQTVVTVTNKSSKPVFELRFKVRLTDKQGNSVVGSADIHNLESTNTQTVDLLKALKHKTTPVQIPFLMNMINGVELAKVEIVKIRIRGEKKANKDESGKLYFFEKAIGFEVDELWSEERKARAKKTAAADYFVISDGGETVFAMDPIDLK